MSTVVTLKEKPDYCFLRVEPVAAGVWSILAGRWWMGENNMGEFITKKPVTLRSHDLVTLAEEIDRVVNLKLNQSTKLELRFLDNEASFSISLCYMDDSVAYVGPTNKGQFRMDVFIDGNFSGTNLEATSFKEEGDFEASSSHRVGNMRVWRISDYFTADDLKSFAQRLCVASHA